MKDNNLINDAIWLESGLQSSFLFVGAQEGGIGDPSYLGT